MAYMTDEYDNLQYIENTMENKINKPNLEVLIKEHTVERERLLKLDAISDFYKSLIDSTKIVVVVPIGLLQIQQ